MEVTNSLFSRTSRIEKHVLQNEYGGTTMILKNSLEIQYSRNLLISDDLFFAILNLSVIVLFLVHDGGTVLSL